ncbi:MAG TPA: CesT family type III secretion system chaperone [Acidimicrobiia bacterium]|nr:CesT family type III secretion system chaperone [Acidimicrobiia bacterium]
MDEQAAALLSQVVDSWVADPDSDVVYAEKVEGRLAVRMRQQVREATTVWFWVGDRSLIAEAYVIPAPAEAEDAYRQALVRNGRSFRVNFALDHEGALVLRARIPLDRVDSTELSYLLAEIYETIEVSFRSLVGLVRQREKLP